MGSTSRYRVKTHRLVREYDLPALSEDLREIFEDISQSVLITDPYRCLGLPNHSLRGELKNHRALAIDWQGISYRLVYRIYDSSAPRWVEILSFAEHDPAYGRAIARKRS